MEPMIDAPADAPDPVPISVAVVMHQRKVLVGVRAKPPFQGCAEFPGGKVEPGESIEVAAVRECREETGLAVVATECLAESVYRDEQVHLRITFIACRVAVPAHAAPIGHPSVAAPFRWIDAGMLGRLEFPPANRPLIGPLQARLATME